MKPEKKQTVLIVHNYYQIPGGEDTVVANEEKMLTEQGHQVFLYTRSNEELRNMGKLSKCKLPFTTVFNGKTYREVKKIIEEKQIDLVHVHNTLNLISPSVYYAAFAKKVPVVQTVHNFRFVCPAATLFREHHICEECLSKGIHTACRYRCYRGSMAQTLACVVSTVIHRALGTYRKINYICLTEFNKQKLLAAQTGKQKPIFDEEKMFVKPNFTFENKTMAEKGEYYLYFGRMESIKGVELILDAFAELREETIYFAGGGTQLKLFQEKARERGQKNAVFLGFLPKEELAKTIRGAKAVIVASQWYEPFGMIVAESYASHVPVIAGNMGNLQELVKDGKTGFHFTYDSKESLIEVIRKIRNDGMNLEQMGETAYEEYRTHFTETMNYQMLKQIYDTVTKPEKE